MTWKGTSGRGGFDFKKRELVILRDISNHLGCILLGDMDRAVRLGWDLRVSEKRVSYLKGLSV